MAVKIVCGALVVKDGKLVLVKEAGEDYGKWNFPAGHLDVGENIFEAALREVKEETNLDVKLDGLLGIYQSIGKDNIVKIFFKASVVGGELQHPKGELLDAKWIDFENFDKISNEDLRTLDLRLVVKDFKDNKIKPLDIIKFDSSKTINL